MTKPRRAVRLRSARDRVIDLLGFGETYPLQDLDVPDERLTVPVNSTAKLVVRSGQPDVRYKLHEPDGTPTRPGPGTLGRDEGTELETPPITQDATFRIHAKKEDFPSRAVYLHAAASVKSGLDVSLRARILAQVVPVAGASTANEHPRIVDFGTPLDVEIDDSQEGVDYHLVREATGGGSEVRLSPDVRGDLGTIVLTSQPIPEDTVFRIRATKTFDASDSRPTQTRLLETALPLFVRANPDVEVTVAPSSVVDFGASARIAIAGSQSSVAYTAFVRMLADEDFAYDAPDAPPPSELVSVSLPGGAEVLVRRPVSRQVWLGTGGFAAAGTAQTGTDGPLELPTGPLEEDTVVVIKAEKVHTSADPIPSEVQVASPAIVLVRPDPAPELEVRISVGDTSTDGRIWVSGGDPGIFYHFRRGQTGQERTHPAYFHKHDPVKPALNKGVASERAGPGLRLEVDFAIPRGDGPPAGADRTRPRPVTPMIDLGNMPVGVELYARAEKARTKIDVPVVPSALIAALPEVRADAETIAPGATARIVVVASQVGERYQLFLGGEPVRNARNGDGNDIAFVSESVDRDSTFEMVATRPTEDGIAVTRVLPIRIGVDAAPTG